MTDILKLSGNMVSISTKPEDAGHAEFARDLLAHNHKLEAINADLLAALEAMLEYDTGTPDDVLNMARAAIAKSKGQQ